MIPGVLSCNFASHTKEDLLSITGTKGEIRVSVFGGEPVRVETGAGVEHWDIPHPPHIAQPLIQECVYDLLGRRNSPSTGESARRTSVVMDTVLNAYYGGRHDEFWLRPEKWPGRRH
jgi:1,5-anhydro-D-fructose reductase (1,5-anhydro-D-mannitol-forming)